MAIRTINYVVTEQGISPSVVQRGGLQGEHRATKLTFVLQKDLLEILAAHSEPDSGNTVMYRFEAYTGAGLKNSTLPVTFVPADEGRFLTLEYPLENWLTRDGGNIRVYLILSVTNTASRETLVDLYTFPALIKLEAVPDADFTDGNNYESLALLSEVAATSAERAVAAAESAEISQIKTEEAKVALESGAEFIFLGGDADSAIDIDLVIDDELSEVSENPVQNSVIVKDLAEYRESAANDLAEVEAEISAEISAISAEITKTQENLNDLTNTVAKSVDYIVDQGTSGIWTYRKWNSGIAECWGTYTYSATITNSGWLNWVGAPASSRVSYPEGLFIERPNENVTAKAETNSVFLYCESNGAGLNTVAQTARYNVMTATQRSTSQTIYLSFDIKGRWK